ncbi:N-acetylglucosamine repressor [Streptomyces sp. MBT84]|uniref:ROK family transcriptional regulator n=1 Tax=unclassified Streptomyces TaxID=2593676 RepID=UPI00074100A4|nr:MULTISPECIES: ROK family transcriptional regulator [unclassified Streptomyces]KUJ42423.1 ROK family transcriptional regulator [Streptomyces sp. NRRL F-5122]MBW8698948.1 N-acetylglucosamine repressor [Streptomyces sp. MBT84]MDX3259586.1 ROK family transcriptional regulator [Streptomyces sp. MI02-2A]REE65182.1 putative NBD/HSP70 family sugar kinase [Streptomyces sp. 3212.3]
MPARDPIAQPEQTWNRRRLRSTNERLLLDRLRAAGSASRAQLARETGLSKPTVSSALAALEEAGLVHEVGTHTPERGRMAVLYAPDPAAGYALGIDIGRSWLRVALAGLDGEVVARADVRNRARTSGAMADLVVTTARQVIEGSGAGHHDVAHAVVGTPGVYDGERRRVRYAMHLPGWGRAGLFDRMRDELGIPLEVHNDANLAALGEYTYGVGAGSRLFAYILIGTGLGMGVVSEGRLFTGAHGGAGEIGFLPWPGRQKPETLEDAVSGVAVVESARAFGMSGQLTAKAVFDAAREGHPAAVRAVQLEGERIAHTVAAAAAVLDPDLVVLGGGVGHSVDLLLRPVRETLRALTPLRPKIAPSRLGEDAVLLGALATALGTARDVVFERRSGS